MTRDEKIALLRGFTAGKIKLDDLLMKELSITIDENGTLFYINGEVVAPDEFDKHIDYSGDGKQGFNVKIE